MFPSELVLDRRVRLGCHYDHADTDLPLFILKCEHRKAAGYADDKLELYNQRLQRMVVGVRLASKPPAVSYLDILKAGDPLFARIAAVDKTVIVIELGFMDEEFRISYLIYDAVAPSLRMIPQRQTCPWISTIAFPVSIARPCHGGDYALVRTGILLDDEDEDEDACLFLWRPNSSSLPWSEKKKSSFPDVIEWSLNRIDTVFSFNGHTYWVDLLCGVSYCGRNALFDDTASVFESGGFIRLPVKTRGYHRCSMPVVQHRTMGVVCGSFIRFVSIDHYLNTMKRTVTVWSLLGHDKGWEKEHELSMDTLWGFEGCGDVPKDLMPIHPILSTEDKDVVYLVLGEYLSTARYLLLAVDMQKKIVTSAPLKPSPPEFPRCFGRHLLKALVGPCDDEGVPIVLTKKKRRSNARNVAEAPIPILTKEKTRMSNAGNVAEAPIHMKKKKKKRRRNAGNVAEAPIPMKKHICC